MGDLVEFTSQITPETPGRPSVRNPFESPNDYQHLRETVVPSPSVFRSKPCKSTPPKFDWSIEEMASLLPVHIDPEEIQRQSLYLSQTRMDSDIEEKRQNAIEQFFTKGTIVPSPWAPASARKQGQLKMKCCGSDPIAEEPEKTSVACQTTLSLPLTFDLEKVLGNYYRHDEDAGDAVPETLSSSSLRRKLFLDGQSSFSGSDSSGPPSPERRFTRRASPGPAAEEEEEEDAASSAACSPLAHTPSTGQFSSSPIQNGRFRDCSLGSLASPLFPHRSSPAGLATPTLSPIVAPGPNTPSSADRKQQSGAAPHQVCAGVAATPSSQSPFVEGCSPIRSCSPHQHGRAKPRLRVRSRLSPPLVSPILHPKAEDTPEAERLPCSPSSSPSSFPLMDLDASSPSGQQPGAGERVVLAPQQPLKAEEDEQKAMAAALKDEEEGGEPSGRLTSSRMGNVSCTDSTRMCVSLLAEGSSVRYDCSMQVDSGYSTTSAGAASLMDAELLEQAAPQRKVFYPNL